MTKCGCVGDRGHTASVRSAALDRARATPWSVLPGHATMKLDDDARAATDESRAAGGRTLGCVVPRWPGALGHRSTAAGDRAPRGRRRIHRCSARRGLRDQARTRCTWPPSGCTCSAWTWPRPHSRSRARRPCSAAPASTSPLPTPCTSSAWTEPSRPCSIVGCSTRSTATSDSAYVASLAAVTGRGGHLYVLCFSDLGPGARGPHPVSQQELRTAFSRRSGWSVSSISPDRIQTRFDAQGVPAWLVKIERT